MSLYIDHLILQLTWNPGGSGSCRTVNVRVGPGCSNSCTASRCDAPTSSLPFTFIKRSPIRSLPERAATPPGTTCKTRYLCLCKIFCYLYFWMWVAPVCIPKPTDNFFHIVEVIRTRYGWTAWMRIWIKKRDKLRNYRWKRWMEELHTLYQEISKDIDD